MYKVGFIGWRGMVGSVLMQRMLEENDFEIFIKGFFVDCIAAVFALYPLAIRHAFAFLRDIGGCRFWLAE